MLTAVPGEPVTVKQPPAFQKARLTPTSYADEQGLVTQTKRKQTLSTRRHDYASRKEFTRLNRSA